MLEHVLQREFMGKFLDMLASFDIILSVKRSSKRMNATKQSYSTDVLFQYETRRTSIVMITTIHDSGTNGNCGMRMGWDGIYCGYWCRQRTKIATTHVKKNRGLVCRNRNDAAMDIKDDYQSGFCTFQLAHLLGTLLGHFYWFTGCNLFMICCLLSCFLRC